MKNVTIVVPPLPPPHPMYTESPEGGDALPIPPWMVGNVLEALYMLGAAERPVTTPVVAGWLGMSMPLTVLLLGHVARSGLVDGGVSETACLTPAGRAAAREVVRRRRATEEMLRTSEGYSADAAQTIAARIAHLIPDAVVEESVRIHGAPDLTPRAEPAPMWAVAMRLQSARVTDQTAPFAVVNAHVA